MVFTKADVVGLSSGCFLIYAGVVDTDGSGSQLASFLDVYQH